MPRLPKKFFLQKTEIIAQGLLGKFLVRNSPAGEGNKILSGMIVETEAYVGAHDAACHASKGKTPRNTPMFKEGGIWYIYFVYGFHHCLNIVTEEKENPCAVLIRALEPVEGIEEMKKNRNVKIVETPRRGVSTVAYDNQSNKLKNLTNGPGKLCQALQITKALNQTSAISKNSVLYIEDRGIKIPKKNIVKAKRIGVDYAGIWKDKLLRFYVKDNVFVSKK